MKVFLLAAVIFSSQIFSQEVNIKEALQQIESGNISKAESLLAGFKKTNPNDPSVIFLDAVLTRDGNTALQKYSDVYEKYPKSNYANAALYRIFSYYYSLGYYKKAESYLQKLKTEYPSSPYIKTADRNIPDVDDSTFTDESPAPTTDETKQYQFTIQAGAFLNPDNAKKLRDQLTDDGYEAEITTKDIGGSTFNIVNVGKFETEEEAQPSLKFLLNNYSLKGRVINLAENNNP